MGLRSQDVLSPPQLAALGSVAVESSYLESLIDALIAQLSATPDKKLKILLGSGLMIGKKLDILSDLGDLALRSQKNKKRWAKIIDELKGANTERTIAIHGIWARRQPYNAIREYILGISPDNPAEATHKAAPKMSADKLSKLAERISDGHSSLWNFYLDAWHAAWMRRFLASERRRSVSRPPAR